MMRKFDVDEAVRLARQEGVTSLGGVPTLARQPGDVKSLSKLGYIAWSEQRYDDAIGRFREVLAIDPRHAAAYVHLGVSYARGRGVPRNEVEAAKWFHLAANQGDPDAQLDIGISYYAGRGAPADDVLAYMWFNLSAAQGNETAIKYRDEVAREMTPGQVAEAQRLAREWKPKPASR